MFSMEKETEIKKELKNLCLSYGWSYGVFWRFHHRNSMLLTLEDAYSMEYARSLTDDMLLQVHMLGEGVIGQAALDGKYRWVFSDSSTPKCSLTDHAQSQQTIVVIPLESSGVFQFGSVNEMLEIPGFVDHTRQIFRELSLNDVATSSLITDSIDPSGEFASLISSCNSLPSTCIQANEFGHNGSSCTDPSSSCVDNQGDFFGFNPLSFLEGSADIQCLDSLFHEPSNLHGFDEFKSTELPTTSHQDHHMDDSIFQWLHSFQDTTTLNDDLLQTLLAELPSSNALERPSDAKVGSTLVPKKGLFSELGLDQLLSNKADSVSFAKSSIEDPICSPMKAQTSLWSDKCFTVDTKSCITDQTTRPQGSSKVSKKRARPGESPRGRPKDRQMIQDRIKELREIIPNSSKCSIDSLLDRTIKHMLFMQGASKYVDTLKRVDEAKAQRDMSSNSGTSGSTTWAVEVGGHNPIVVEDLGHSGQMLIEMICEEHGFFLEIADVIRGFGLTILKGVMEARDGKIRAHFIVEASRRVTRMEVLMSLLQLLEESSTVGSKFVVEGNKVFGNKTSVLSNYHHQPMLPSSNSFCC